MFKKLFKKLLKKEKPIEFVPETKEEFMERIAGYRREIHILNGRFRNPRGYKCPGLRRDSMVSIATQKRIRIAKRLRALKAKIKQAKIQLQ
jgi:hypothetical protein